MDSVKPFSTVIVNILLNGSTSAMKINIMLVWIDGEKNTPQRFHLSEESEHYMPQRPQYNLYF